MHYSGLLVGFRIDISIAVGETSGYVGGLKLGVMRREFFFIAKVRHSVYNGQ